MNMPLNETEQVTEELAPAFRREKFIPITRSALISRLAREEAQSAATGNYAPTAKLFQYLSVWRHQTYQKRLARLKECYLPFSPDADTKRIIEHDETELLALKDDLIKNITVLLQQANYVEIDNDELDEMLQANSIYGLELSVDLSEFDEMLLFARGHEIEVVEKRVVDNLYLFKRRFEVPIYRRLFLLLKMKDEQTRLNEIIQNQDVSERKARKILKKLRKGLPDDPGGNYVYLRLFKNIPQEDLEMMFPNTQVKLKMFDKVKLGVTAGGGTVAGVAGSASKVMAAVATANPIALAAALFGIVGIIARQIMNVFNTRTKYMMQLAQRLFFHSLANNRGVLTLLVDRAEEEDIKEEMLLYFFLMRHPMPHSELREGGQLDLLIEAFLTKEFEVSVDFDLEDALQRLKADQLVTEMPNGLIEALPPEQACNLLERKWRNLMASEPEEDNAVAYEAEV